jgi:hypothetical protein
MQMEPLGSPLPFWNICRRVYLVWAVLLGIGFAATQFHQEANINWLWLVISVNYPAPTAKRYGAGFQ